MFYRRKWSAFLVAVLIAALGAAFLITSIPRYRSDAVVVVRFGRMAVPTTNLARDPTPFFSDQNERREVVQAHADILTSPDLAQAVIAKFGLERLYPAIASRPPAVGTAMDAAVKRFEANLYVSPELNSDVIHISVTDPDPKIAQGVLAIVIEEYMQRESEIFASSSFDFQKTQTEDAYKRVIKAQNDLSAYKSSTGVTDFEAQMLETIRQQRDVLERLTKAQVALAEAAQRQSALEQLMKTVPANLTNSATDKYRPADDAQARVTDLRARERQMIAAHGTQWPELAGLRASIAEAQATASSLASASGSRSESRPNTVYQGMQADFLRATADAKAGEQVVALLTTQAQDVKAQIEAMEAKRAGLSQRQREVEIADAAYRTISLHLEDSRIGSNVLRNGISRTAVISNPTLPYAPSSPRYFPIAFATAIAAVLGGLVFAVLLELIDDRFTSAEQVTARLKVPVLATFDKT